MQKRVLKRKVQFFGIDIEIKKWNDWKASGYWNRSWLIHWLCKDKYCDFRLNFELKIDKWSSINSLRVYRSTDFSCLKICWNWYESYFHLRHLNLTSAKLNKSKINNGKRKKNIECSWLGLNDSSSILILWFFVLRGYYFHQWLCWLRNKSSKLTLEKIYMRNWFIDSGCVFLGQKIFRFLDFILSLRCWIHKYSSFNSCNIICCCR